MNEISSPGRRSALAAGIGSLALLAACSERGRFFGLPGGGGDVSSVRAPIDGRLDTHREGL